MDYKPYITLLIKAEWFNMIASGQKTTDYREIKKYYRNIFPNTLFEGEPIIKLNHVLYKPDEINILFKNGYSANSPTLLVELEHIDVGFGKEEWGATEGVEYYRLHLGKILETNGKPRKNRVPTRKFAFQARVRKAGELGAIKTKIIYATGVKKATEYLHDRNYDIFTEPFLIASKARSRMDVTFQV